MDIRIKERLGRYKTESKEVEEEEFAIPLPSIVVDPLARVTLGRDNVANGAPMS